MEIKLSNFNNGKVLYNQTYPVNFDLKGSVEEFEHVFNLDACNVFISEKWLFGTHISFVEINAIDEGAILIQCNYNHIGFLFCIDGILNFRDSKNQQTLLTVAQNQQNINWGVVNQVLNFKEPVKFIYIQLSKEHYYNLTGDEFDNDILAFSNKEIPNEINLILNSLLNQKNHKRVKRIGLELKIYELLVFYINKFNYKASINLKKEDLDKILYAKKLVESNIQQADSLIELSRKAGINDYKLKKGFKELTGETVFGFLYKIRMEKAYYYLSNEKKTVSEVAFLVGYKNAQHFTTAFKRKYNILPGSLNKENFLHANV
jgi:AraC-like DNA-binding protein